MKLKVRKKTPAHVYVGVFVEDKCNGDLCLSKSEWRALKNIKECNLVTVDINGNKIGDNHE